MHSLAAALRNRNRATTWQALAGTTLLLTSPSRTRPTSFPSSTSVERQDPTLARLEGYHSQTNSAQSLATTSSLPTAPCLVPLPRQRLAFVEAGVTNPNSVRPQTPLSPSTVLRKESRSILTSNSVPLLDLCTDLRGQTCVQPRTRSVRPAAPAVHWASAAWDWASTHTQTRDEATRASSGLGSSVVHGLRQGFIGDPSGLVSRSGYRRSIFHRSSSGYASRRGKFLGSGRGQSRSGSVGSMPGAEMSEMDIQEIARIMQLQASKLAEQAMSMSSMGRAVDTASKGLTSSPETSKMTIFNHPLPTGVQIPRLGLGVFMATPQETEESIQFALAEGYRHFDTARLYKNEAAVGRAVKSSGIPREEIFVTTKLWNSDHGYQNTLTAFQKSLAELGLDYVDMFLIHSPLRTDSRLETWRAMEEILRSGKAKAVGVSNYGIHHLEELMATCAFTPAVNQIELHPFCTREKLVAFCREHGIALQAYSPLTKGKRLKDPTLLEIAGRYKKSTAQLLIRWSLQKDFIVIPKSVTPSRIAANAQVFNFEISPEDMAALDALNENFVTGWDPTRSS